MVDHDAVAVGIGERRPLAHARVPDVADFHPGVLQLRLRLLDVSNPKRDRPAWQRLEFAPVSVGIYIGRRAPFDASPTDRIMVYSFLEIMFFLINVIVFILLGLQFPGILARITDLPTATLVFWASFVSLAVIALRLAWAIIFGQLIFRLLPAQRARYPKLLWRQSLVIGWAGMRGAVSLAAALAIPTIIAGGAPFPKCNFIPVLIAAAIFLTIILPSLTLLHSFAVWA